MSSPSPQVHKIWTEQCAATEDIREAFGLENALDYLIGEKLFTFLMVSERDPSFATELPAFVAPRGELRAWGRPFRMALDEILPMYLPGACQK